MIRKFGLSKLRIQTKTSKNLPKFFYEICSNCFLGIYFLIVLHQPPIMTVGQPIEIVFGGPMASRIVSPCRAAGIKAIVTVAEGVITTPGPCGGTGDGVAQT